MNKKLQDVLNKSERQQKGNVQKIFQIIYHTLVYTTV